MPANPLGAEHLSPRLALAFLRCRAKEERGEIPVSAWLVTAPAGSRSWPCDRRWLGQRPVAADAGSLPKD